MRQIIDSLNARGCLRFIPDKIWLKYKYKQKFGKRLNLDNPKTFNEKLQWMKLYYREPICSIMVDKYEAKKYVSELVGEDYIIPTYGVYDSFDEINFSELPNQFVIKCTHDSGGLVICRDKEKFEINSAKRKINRCLKRNYYWHGREWVYKEIKPRIIVEKYMEDRDARELMDYKFYCFDGKPEFLYISHGLENHATASISFFNLSFHEMPFYRSDYKRFDIPPEKPAKFEDMVQIAAQLSKGFPFLRVDLYQINGQVYFSELTFVPCGGFMPIKPETADIELGKMLKLHI